MHPSTVTEHLSSLTQDELIEHLFKNPVYLLNTCITVIEGILRVCGPQTVPNPQCNSDLRLAAALLDALDTHLGRVLRAKELSAQYVRNFWEACLSTEFPCTLLRFVSSPIFWTRTLVRTSLWRAVNHAFTICYVNTGLPRQSVWLSGFVHAHMVAWDRPGRGRGYSRSRAF